jgi:hypothetical protein
MAVVMNVDVNINWRFFEGAVHSPLLQETLHFDKIDSVWIDGEHRFLDRDSR